MVSAADGHDIADRRKRRAWWRLGLSVLVASLLAMLAFGWLSRPRYAYLGDVRLESGETIHDVVIGYRTAGQLNASRSNAVLVAPWFQGTSAEIAWQVGPEKLVDSSTNFVIMVDALGNGVSSSPSNSQRQAGAAFPRFTVRDIVATQHRLVTETFGLSRLRAVVGISMGGMQVLEWVAAHPEMIEKAVPIVGSPKPLPDDIDRCQETIRYVQASPWARTRTQIWGAHPRGAIAEWRLQPYDHIRQSEAMITHDISRHFGGSMERAAAAIGNRMLMVSTWADRSVNPKPAFELARMSGATILELDGRCGHQAPSCERATLWPAVRRFIDGGTERATHR